MKYAIMGYAERSIRQLESKFQKQTKIKKHKEAAKRSINNCHRGKEVHSEASKPIWSLVEDQFITGGDVLGLKDAFNYVLIVEDLDTENLAAS